MDIENKFWAFLPKFFIFPIAYLFIGIKNLFKPASTAFFATFVIIILYALISGKLDLPAELTKTIFNIAIFFPMILVIFALPSSYAYYDVNKDHIDVIVAFLIEEDINNVNIIECLQENIEILNSRIISRISFYKWLIGSVWATYVLIINVELRVFLKVDTENWEKFLGDGIQSFFWYFILTITALLLVIVYKRASEYLIKSIEFSCVELKCNLIE